ncbi:MAG: hypothetical protein KJO38_09480, partial [Gammaproteobacteria bacterium]|nr:hypothetical protein [Gammaproteobacteria bacterium]
LLLRTLDDFMEKGFVFRDRDSRMHFIEAARNAVDILIADADFQRPLYQVLMGVTHEQHRPEFMARTFLYWRHAVETIPRSERLARQQDIDLLAHSLMAHFTGLMEMWINFDMTDEEFSAHVTCAAIIDAYSFLRPEDQREMLELLDKTKAGLPLRPAHGGAVATLRVKTA